MDGCEVKERMCRSMITMHNNNKSKEKDVGNFLPYKFFVFGCYVILKSA